MHTELVVYVAMNEIVWECSKDKQNTISTFKDKYTVFKHILRQLKSCELLICLYFVQTILLQRK